jgi:hypothetical protein
MTPALYIAQAPDHSPTGPGSPMHGAVAAKRDGDEAAVNRVALQLMTPPE